MYKKEIGAKDVLVVGKDIPVIGFGTFGLKDEEMMEVIRNAIIIGFRLFDTAYEYGNEKSFGNAINKCISEGLVKREDLFIQTKFYPESPYGYEDVYKQFESSIEKLGIKYVDAYLIHKPVPWHSELNYAVQNREVWKAFAELKKGGKIKHLGVSNFLERHIEFLEADKDCIPEINQIEIHPLFHQRGLSEWCRINGILVEGWSPLARGRALNNNYISKLSKKYYKTPAQICLAWQIQMGTVPITSANTKEWIQSSYDSIQLKIDHEDIQGFLELNSDDLHQDLWLYKRREMY